MSPIPEVEEACRLVETLSEQDKLIANLEVASTNHYKSLCKCQSDMYSTNRRIENLINVIANARNMGEVCLSEWGMLSDNKGKVYKLVEQLVSYHRM